MRLASLAARAGNFVFFSETGPSPNCRLKVFNGVSYPIDTSGKYAISSFAPHELRTQDLSIQIKALKAKLSTSLDLKYAYMDASVAWLRQ